MRKRFISAMLAVLMVLTLLTPAIFVTFADDEGSVQPLTESLIYKRID